MLHQILAYEGTAQATPIMFKIIFWILLILTALGGFIWSDNPRWQSHGSLVLVILLAILGLATFGF
jgi:hypothetical protein